MIYKSALTEYVINLSHKFTALLYHEVVPKTGIMLYWIDLNNTWFFKSKTDAKTQ